MQCYVDYTCGHSYRAWMWLRDVDATIDWRTFSLKEINRDPDEPRAFDDLESISVLALALSHAAREADFLRFHDGAFDAFHSGRVDRDGLLAIAKDAGLDITTLDRAALFDRVRAEHDHARERWAMFGTPTLVDEDATAFLRFEESPAADHASAAWERVRSLLGTEETPTIRITATNVSLAD